MPKRGEYSPSKKRSITLYYWAEQAAALRKLNAHTRVPIAEYIREGVNMVLERENAAETVAEVE